MKFNRGREERGIFGLTGEMEDSALPPFEAVPGVPPPGHGAWNRVSMGSPMKLGRFKLAVFLGILTFGLLSARTAYLQIYLGDHFRTIAESNRVRVHAIPSHRGILKDRTGIPLASNLPSFRLVAYTSSLPEKREEMLKAVAEEFSLSAEELEGKIKEAGDVEEILLAKNLPYEQAIAFLSREEGYPGIHVELSETRGYPTNAIPSLSHVLGYTGPLNESEYTDLKEDGYRKFDVIGKQGIEAAHELELRGTFGEEVFEVNAQGKLLRTISQREPVDGRDLTLTIDARLQAYSELALQKHLANRPVKRAAVVALDPRNGEVLALVSYPSFDANLFSQGISEDQYQALLNDPNAPLFPRASSGEYPSGSTIKPFFAAAALTEKIITPETSFLSVGGLTLGDRFFPDWRPGGHGITNVYWALADSVNTFFYIIGGGNEAFNGMGVETLMSYASKFGLGRKTGIDITGEADGFLPDKAWKLEVKGEPWYIGDTYNVSIGQGDILVSPLQMARGTAAIANGGELVTPHLLVGEEKPKERIIEKEVTDIVREGMRRTVTIGTARSLSTLPVEAGAKTGTAQWNVNKVPHSWFTGFAPYDNPTITLAVLVEEGGDVTAATPIARDILDWYFSRQ
jgi:penicillin-binding protein 2